ncbi:GntR family transcriptional regulator [Salinispora arenicola]|uniref:GntR family transcriptional regulator n=1 Tax=Salinispora arenicola TaxID=168697 RepID=A0A542XP50_SALAC|nr:GntR family transcriptional regulator [Salinispora arenicola]TQL37638.1 GntR family transcriptional regulator [Salinispora arenicola]GIM87890.1 GntR family transcriptional regulator [Salinispora arenicola]
MNEPAYVAIAGEYAWRIRKGELRPGTQLPSYSEIAGQYGVSDIVVRKALELLQGQGLVRSVRRRGVFVADRPNLVRISPERQMESPEVTFGNESNQEIRIDREVEQVHATDEMAEVFGLSPGDRITHIVTRASEGGRPISISDTYQPLDVIGTSNATFLEETVADRLPAPMHAEWLQAIPGDLIKTVHQRFFASDDRVVMISDVSYPRDRYDSFVFRMPLSASS